MSDLLASDTLIRQAAVRHLDRLGTGRALTSEDLKAGFVFEGDRIPLVNPQRGIFKPARMRHLLSIRTVFPKAGSKIWYDDQRKVHGQIHAGDELVDYAFMGKDPNAADNRWLREAMEAQIPVIYFLGVSPGRYAAIFPTFIVGWSANELKASVAFSASSAGATTYAAPDAPERRYGLKLVSQRLHQATFREAVLAAYGDRCAISRLPEPRLLDAAHIMADRHETLGQPVVPNGMPLSKVHHAAWDANLIGIDPDYRIHVSEQLLAMNDGPMLEQGIKAMAGRTILMPSRRMDWPDRNRLAERFEGYTRSQ